jgi:hypothetical protein
MHQGTAKRGDEHAQQQNCAGELPNEHTASSVRFRLPPPPCWRRSGVSLRSTEFQLKKRRNPVTVETANRPRAKQFTVEPPDDSVGVELEISFYEVLGNPFQTYWARSVRRREDVPGK